jgi:peroxiredoxin
MLEPETLPRKGREWKKKLVFWVLAAMILAIVGYGLGLLDVGITKARKVECMGGDELSAPLFRLPDLKGNHVDLISFKGQVILIEFWATWCGPCRQEIPYLNQLYAQYKSGGLVVIGISLDRKDPAEVQKFLDNLGVKYFNLMGNDEVFENYSRLPGLGPVRGIPATFLIDRQGRICKLFTGLTERQVLEEAIQSTL